MKCVERDLREFSGVQMLVDGLRRVILGRVRCVYPAALGEACSVG